MRGRLLEVLPALGLEVEEGDLSVEELLEAGEVWVSNALVGVRRVGAVGRRRWGSWPVFTRLPEAGIPVPGWPSPAGV